MVLSHGNAHSHTAKMEQIITEFFAKTLHIILESRALSASSPNSYGGGDKSDSSPCSSSSPSPSVSLRDKWFNLALRECPPALVNINNLECLIIDVTLVHRSLVKDPMTPKRVLPKSYSLKDRYPPCYHGEELGFDAKSEKIVERWVLQYENRKIKDSNSGTRQSSNFWLQILYTKLNDVLRSLYAKVRVLPAYRIFKNLCSSTKIRPFILAHRVSSFVEPFTLKEESGMVKFRFAPVDTSSGMLCLKVIYFPSAANLIGDRLSSLFARVIPDYVGSPLADLSRKFSSVSSRRCSSNYADSKASSTSSTSITDSTLPIYSKSNIFVSNSSSCIFRPRSLNPSIQRNGASIEDCCNPSPSPSTCHTCSSSSTTVLRPEAVNSSGYTDRSTNVMQSGATDQKVFSLGKDELQKYSGVRISANSRSYRDDFDGADFSCPFDVNCPRSRKSNDATVGAVVGILKKAQPLHQDFNTSEYSSTLYVGLRGPTTPTSRIDRTTKPKEIFIQEASIATRKTTSDSLEECEGYMEMKNWLVNKPQI